MKLAEPVVNAISAGWMQLLSGASFYPLAPNPEVLTLDDVAIPLSRICRYGGHCLEFYSVAEHSVLMARHLRALGRPEHVCLQALMHDASEAFLADIIRPVKPHIVGYRDIEARLMFALSIRFGFTWPALPEVHDLDCAILAVERHANMALTSVPDDKWGITVPAPTEPRIDLCYWSPRQAAAEFVNEFFALGGTE